jgi:hypothetical protein
MFYRVLFLFFLFAIFEASSDLTTNNNKNELSSNEKFLLEEIANLRNEIVFLRKRVSKIEENDLESDITEIRKILETHGLVSILQTLYHDKQTSKQEFFN